MTCGRARRLLWPDAGPRAATPDVVAARAHVAGCDACREFLRDMAAMRDALVVSAPVEEAPPELRARVHAAVARARAEATMPGRSRARTVRRLAAGGLLAAAALLSVVQVQHSRDPLSTIARDHARTVAASNTGTANPAAVGRWLTGRVRFAVSVPPLPGAALRGARVYELAGRRGASVEYDVNGVTLTYVVVPSSEPPPELPARFHHSRRAGFGVVSWHDRGLLHVLVGDLSDAELGMLARACVSGIRQTRV